jgi:hypothetical protein
VTSNWRIKPGRFYIIHRLYMIYINMIYINMIYISDNCVVVERLIINSFYFEYWSSIRLRNNFINQIQSKMNIFVPKSKQIGFWSDLHISNNYMKNTRISTFWEKDFVRKLTKRFPRIVQVIASPSFLLLVQTVQSHSQFGMYKTRL